MYYDEEEINFCNIELKVKEKREYIIMGDIPIWQGEIGR